MPGLPRAIDRLSDDQFLRHPLHAAAGYIYDWDTTGGYAMLKPLHALPIRKLSTRDPLAKEVMTCVPTEYSLFYPQDDMAPTIHLDLPELRIAGPIPGLQGWYVTSTPAALRTASRGRT